MEYRIKTILAAIGFVLSGISGIAQTGPGSFSLKEAQQYAMDNSYVLQNTKHDITIAQKEVWATISTGLPQVSGSANYMMNLKLPVQLVPAQFFGGEEGELIEISFGQKYNSDFGFQVSQQIFDGSYLVGVGSAQIYLDMARQANEKSEIDIKDAVAQAYYSVLIGEENKEVMVENLENLKQIYSETRAYFDNGFREEIDVDQTLMMVKNAENEILKAEREIEIARTVLKYTMGYDLAQPIVLTEQLSNYIDPLVNGDYSPGIDQTSHIDYRMASTNLQVSEKLLKLEKAAYLPTLNSFFSYTKTAYGDNANLFSSDSRWIPSSMIGFQLSVPIFNSGNKMMRVQQAKIELTKAQNNRRLAETTIQKDYLTAAAEMESALEKYENDNENLELSEKILEKSKIKFNNGLISSTELSQLETQYIQAYGSYVGSTLQLLQAHQNLKKAAGEI